MSKPRLARLPFGHANDIVQGTGGLLVSGYGCITMISCYNPTGSAVQIALFDGSSSNGQAMLELLVGTASALQPIYPDAHMFPFETGLFIAGIASTVKGSVWAWLDHDCADYLAAEYYANKAQIAETALDFRAAMGV